VPVTEKKNEIKFALAAPRFDQSSGPGTHTPPRAATNARRASRDRLPSRFSRDRLRAMPKSVSQSTGLRPGTAVLVVVLAIVRAAATAPVLPGRGANTGGSTETSVWTMRAREAQPIVVEHGRNKVLNDSIFEAWNVTVKPCPALADRKDRNKEARLQCV